MSPQYDRRAGDTALVFASWARTALDDPEAIAPEDLPRHNDPTWDRSHTLYAIDRLDDLFALLDPADETRENLARALTESALIVRAIQETIAAIGEAGEPGYEDYLQADGEISSALDSLDDAIATLNGGEPVIP
jgi:hypothetical protein